MFGMFPRNPAFMVRWHVVWCLLSLLWAATSDYAWAAAGLLLFAGGHAALAWRWAHQDDDDDDGGWPRRVPAWRMG